MQQFTRIVTRNSVFQFAAQVAIKILSFIFSVVIVRNLGAEAFGQYAGIMAFGLVFVFFSDLGLSPYVVRQIARWRDTPEGGERIRELMTNVTVLRLVLSLLTVLMIIGTAWLTGRPTVMLLGLALSTLGIFLYAVQGTSAAVLAGYERLDQTSQATVIARLVFVVLGGIALWQGYGYYGLIVASLIEAFCLMWLCWRAVKALGIRRGRVRIRTWLPLLRASLPFGMIGLALGLSYRFDSFLLNITRGDAETGYYNAAYHLVFSAVIFSNVLNTSLYPSLTRQATRDASRLPGIYERALRYLVLMSLPIAIGTSLLADQLVPLLFKAAYLPAVPALQIVIWVVPLMYLSEFLGYVLLIAGQEQRAAQAVMISTGINVALNLVLVPRFGFLAAAVMTVVTEAVLVGQYLWVLAPQLKRLAWLNVVRSLFAALVMGMCVWLLREMPIGLTVLVAGLVYAGLLLLFQAVGRDEWQFVLSLRRRKSETAAE